MDKNDFGLPIDDLFDFDNNGNLDPFEKAIETGVITQDFDDDEEFDDFEDFDDFDDDEDFEDFDDF